MHSEEVMIPNGTAVPHEKSSAFPNGKKRPFAARMDEAGYVTGRLYDRLKTALLSYYQKGNPGKRLRSRITLEGESYLSGGDLVLKITLVGRYLRLYFDLDPIAFAVSKYHHRDVSSVTKHKSTPLLLRLTSSRREKNAYELMDIMLTSRGYEKDESSVPMDHAAVFDGASETHIRPAPADDDPAGDDERDAVFPSGVRRSFAVRMDEAGYVTGRLYDRIKRAWMSFRTDEKFPRKVKSRLSKDGETLLFGGRALCKIMLVGGYLRLYFDLDPSAYPTSKYHHRDVSHIAKYQNTPLLIRLTSPRQEKRACELIADLLAEIGFVPDPDYTDEDYAAVFSGAANAAAEAEREKAGSADALPVLPPVPAPVSEEEEDALDADEEEEERLDGDEEEGMLFRGEEGTLFRGEEGMLSCAEEGDTGAVALTGEAVAVGITEGEDRFSASEATQSWSPAPCADGPTTTAMVSSETSSPDIAASEGEAEGSAAEEASSAERIREVLIPIVISSPDREDEGRGKDSSLAAIEGVTLPRRAEVYTKEGKRIGRVRRSVWRDSDRREVGVFRRSDNAVSLYREQMLSARLDRHDNVLSLDGTYIATLRRPMRIVFPLLLLLLCLLLVLSAVTAYFISTSMDHVPVLFVADRDGTAWEDGRDLPVFYNERFGDRIIAPGQTGAYAFSIKNDSDDGVTYHLDFTAENPAGIRLHYRLLRDGDYIGDGLYHLPEDLLCQGMTLSAGSSSVFLLEWWWEDDADIDTAAGLSQASYVLSINFSATVSP